MDEMPIGLKGQYYGQYCGQWVAIVSNVIEFYVMVIQPTYKTIYTRRNTLNAHPRLCKYRRLWVVPRQSEST